jgi:hypothetical protein
VIQIAAVDASGQVYAECTSATPPIETDGHAAELIGACWEQGAKRLMVHSVALSPAFFDLKSGIAGMLLQKLVNYQIKAVLIAADDKAYEGRFGEMVVEANEGKQFGCFRTRAEAERWLVA